VQPPIDVNTSLDTHKEIRMTSISTTRVIRFILTVACAASVAACSTSGALVSWREEVKLSDGRKIVVEQRKQCDPGHRGTSNADCIARESWLTFDLPEFSAAPIVWHQRLFALLLNVSDGNLYVVGYPRTELEYEQLGRPKPPYIGFIWRAGQWQKIPIKDIPTAIYDTNLFLEDVLPGATYLTLERKQQMMGDSRIARFMRRIDPNLDTKVSH
jgi:hypothetical protein